MKASEKVVVILIDQPMQESMKINSRLFNKSWKVQILDEWHESENTFQLVSNTVLFLITPLKSVVF